MRENGGCGEIFEVILSLSDYTSYAPKCPKCQSFKFVARNFFIDLPNNQIAVSTVGSLADKNTHDLSDDARRQLTQKHNAYRFKTPNVDPPKGMQWLRKRGVDTQHHIDKNVKKQRRKIKRDM